MDKEELINRLCKKGYVLIEDDVFNISKRISRYDKKLLLFYNPLRKRYEIHTSFSYPTYCVGNDTLDARLLKKLKQADNRTEYGFREKMDTLEKQSEKEEKDRTNKYNDLKYDILRRTERKFFGS